jgi:hypothetical protein
MSLSISRSALLVAATLAVGALGAMALFYRAPESPALDDSQPSKIEKEGKEFLEAWKAGPWAVRPQDVKGMPVVTDLRIHPLKACSESYVHISLSDGYSCRAVETLPSKKSVTVPEESRCAFFTAPLSDPPPYRAPV